MNEFTVRGEFKDRDGWRGFETHVEAENDAVAAEHTYALFGSNHGLERTQVTVEEVEGR